MEVASRASGGAPCATPVEPLPPRAEVKTNNLPFSNTAFIGREHDVAEIKTLLDEHRLVTLLGSGGVGKTRLAVQIGTELLKGYPDGVWLVDLAPIVAGTQTTAAHLRQL